MNELVYLKNDEAVCDSLQVAEKFGKEHKNVLQSIDNLIAENSAVKIMFKISSYKSGNGQSYRKFYMNRDGFSLLAMGFTGREDSKSFFGIFDSRIVHAWILAHSSNSFSEHLTSFILRTLSLPDNRFSYTPIESPPYLHILSI